MNAGELSACQPCPDDRFHVLPVEERIKIRTFVENNDLEWARGAGFYQFTKTENIQVYKEVIARDDDTGLFFQGPVLRGLLGFREGDSCEAMRLKPKKFEGLTLFIQSTSYNRMLVAGTVFLYEREPGGMSKTALPVASMGGGASTSGASGGSGAASPSAALQRVQLAISTSKGEIPAEYGDIGSAETPVVHEWSVDDVRGWTVGEVVDWARILGLGDHAARFEEAEIDGDVLLTLSKSDLKVELGLPLGAVRKVTKQLQKIRGGACADAEAALGIAGSTEIDLDDIVMEREVGHGAFGRVYRGVWRGATVAVKLLTMRHLDDEQIAAFRREAQILGALRHPNIVYFFGVSSQPPNLGLVTEFCDGGSLESFLYNAETNESLAGLDNWGKLKILLGVASGMTYLAGQGIVHRDLAARNVLLSDGLVAKITDFGMSRQELLPKGQNVTVETTGPLKYMSPGALRGHFSELTDVWSYGVLLYEVVFESAPYPTMTPIEVAAGVLANTIRLPLEGCHEAWAEILSACTALDPKDRPNFAAIYEHLLNLYEVPDNPLRRT